MDRNGLHDVTNIPRCVLGNGLMTSGAQAVLLPSDRFAPPRYRSEHFLAPAGLEALVPIGIMRI